MSGQATTIPAPVRAARAPERSDSSAADRGPLLAVCGTCGGAGASTLSYLLASAARLRHAAEVLAVDASGDGGLAVYARSETVTSLAELSRAVEAGEVPLHSFAVSPEGVRVVGARRLDRSLLTPSVRELLRDACERHALTTLDCGTAWRATARCVLDVATHALWLLPATVAGCVKATAALADRPERAALREALVARLDREERRVALADLQRLAAEFDLPLILMPHVNDLLEAEITEAMATSGVGLEAIFSFLAR